MPLHADGPGPPRLWPVAVAYAGAVAAVVLFSVAAAGFVRALYPDVPAEALLGGLPGLVAGAVASSLALLTTAVVAASPLDPERLRLRPGWEDGRTLAVVVAGMLALGQVLDSATALAGLGGQGTLADVRRALAGASGPELFVAVVALGPLAGPAEELFFRGYMQTRLRARLGAGPAVGLAAAAFAVLHLDWLHGLLAFVLGLYLGWITELTGSVLPAMVAHAVNNMLFTLLAARLGTMATPGLDLALLGASAVVLAGCLRWLRRAAPAR